VLAINGEELTAKEDIYKLLRHAGDAPVQLTLKHVAVTQRHAQSNLPAAGQRIGFAVSRLGGAEPPEGG